MYCYLIYTIGGIPLNILHIIRNLALCLIMLTTVFPITSSANDVSQDLIISEYIEGSSYNKAIELYNPTSTPIDLSDYTLVSFVNGANLEQGTKGSVQLEGTLEPNDVYVIAHQSASDAILQHADLTGGSTAFNFNGDDTLVLFKNLNKDTYEGTVVDSIGQLSFDPGSAFGQDVRTQDTTLIRSHLTPDTNLEDNYDPSVYFTALPKDTFDHIGSFQSDVTAPEPEQPQSEYTVTVSKVTDGDTIKIEPAILGSNTIRMTNMDTPETYHLGAYDAELIDSNPDHSQKYHGDLATKALSEMISVGDTVTIKVNVDKPTDDYGRILGQVYDGNTNINLEMVKQGYAVSYFIYPVGDMNVYHQFQDAVKYAKDQQLGIWQTEHTLMELPFVFRARSQGKGLQRYVGNSDTKEYYLPENYQDVSVEHRIFFTEEQAKANGYTLAEGQDAPTEPTEPEQYKQVTIDKARTAAQNTPVIVEGIVTYIDGKNAYIEDGTGGIVVRSENTSFNIGEQITAQGKTSSYFGLSQIVTEDITQSGAMNEVIAKEIDLSEANETHEGQYVALTNVTVQSVNEYNEFLVKDEAGHTVLIKGQSQNDLEVGQTYSKITGPLSYSYSNYKVLLDDAQQHVEEPTTEEPTLESPSKEKPNKGKAKGKNKQKKSHPKFDTHPSKVKNPHAA